MMVSKYYNDISSAIQLIDKLIKEHSTYLDINERNELVRRLITFSETEFGKKDPGVEITKSVTFIIAPSKNL